SLIDFCFLYQDKLKLLSLLRNISCIQTFASNLQGRGCSRLSFSIWYPIRHNRFFLYLRQYQVSSCCDSQILVSKNPLYSEQQYYWYLLYAYANLHKQIAPKANSY